MEDDVFKIFEGMVRQVPFKVMGTKNFKLAAHYSNTGWKVIKYSATENDDVLIEFEKEAQIKKVRLTLQDQIKWLQLLERNKK